MLTKRHVRQKLNLELGRALLRDDPRRASKALQKAADESDGLTWYRKEAQKTLASLK
jgi:hypothetical protein